MLQSCTVGTTHYGEMENERIKTGKTPYFIRKTYRVLKCMLKTDFAAAPRLQQVLALVIAAVLVVQVRVVLRRHREQVRHLALAVRATVRAVLLGSG